eukprot:6581890-Prymnesium_polylepis.1
MCGWRIETVGRTCDGHAFPSGPVAACRRSSPGKRFASVRRLELARRRSAGSTINPRPQVHRIG